MHLKYAYRLSVLKSLYALRAVIDFFKDFPHE